MTSKEALRIYLKLLKEEGNIKYESTFEKASGLLGRELNILDYHFLYSYNLDDLTSSLMCRIYSLKKPNRSQEFNKILEIYLKERSKLNSLFNEYVTKTDPNIRIDELEKQLKILFENNFTKPKYITELIDEGYIMPDGKTATAGLEKIAEFLYTKIENLSADVLLQFRKKDGSEFTPRTAQAAVNRIKPQ